jgi:hypothetical protein
MREGVADGESGVHDPRDRPLVPGCTKLLKGLTALEEATAKQLETAVKQVFAVPQFLLLTRG